MSARGFSEKKVVQPSMVLRPDTLADLIRRLGGISPSRIRLHPAPGTATIRDAERNKLCELIEGTLVEKPMGQWEALTTVHLIRILSTYVEDHDLGELSAPDGGYELAPEKVRLPDISFVSNASMTDGYLPDDPFWKLAPDLAIEVLSKSNTPREMKIKRKTYFDAGVKEVWMVDPVKKTFTVYKSETEFEVLKEPAVLSGDPILPGFRLSLKAFFGRANRRKRPRSK